MGTQLYEGDMVEKQPIRGEFAYANRHAPVGLLTPIALNEDCSLLKQRFGTKHCPPAGLLVLLQFRFVTL